jgi:hypothetical protein
MERFLISSAFACGLLLAGNHQARAATAPEKPPTAVATGLRWLVKQQHKDGRWTADEGRFPVALTAFAGMALLMEGSTTHSGRYAKNLQRARDWLVHQSQHGGGYDGLIGNPNASSGGVGYLFGHSYAMLFLATVLSEETDAARRRQLRDLLERAVRFTAQAQTSRGGWGYIAAREGADFDHGPSTVAQVQALHAADRAGIKGTLPILKKANAYLHKCTTANGGLVYSLAAGAGGAERPAVTAAALAGALGRRDCSWTSIKKWLKFCDKHIPIDTAPPRTDYDYTHYYYAQVLYKLGDKGYRDLFPDTAPADLPSWSKYRKARFPAMHKAQRADGSWNSGPLGPVYSTALTLPLFLLEKEKVRLYRRIPSPGRAAKVEHFCHYGFKSPAGKPKQDAP